MTWPARSVLNAIYAFMVEGAGEQKQVDEFDERLNAPASVGGKARERDMLAYAREVLHGGGASGGGDSPGEA